MIFLMLKNEGTSPKPFQTCPSKLYKTFNWSSFYILIINETSNQMKSPEVG